MLPVHVTSRINRAPQSPTQAAVLLPGLPRDRGQVPAVAADQGRAGHRLPGADLWVAFTQQALWQIWNGKDSKPFRNTDYEPEAIYMVPTPDGMPAAAVRLAAGATRSWAWRTSRTASPTRCRAAGTASTSVPASSAATGRSPRACQQAPRRDPRTDNNPDLVSYRGRGEFQLTWAPGAVDRLAAVPHHACKTTKYGALQFEWTYPVYRDQPNGLRWFVQLFRGYGETLTDYNFRQTSIGAGVTFLRSDGLKLRLGGPGVQSTVGAASAATTATPGIVLAPNRMALAGIDGYRPQANVRRH